MFASTFANNPGPVHAPDKISINGVDYSYTYDSNGNMTGAPDFTDPDNVATRAFTYNADNMPTQIVHTQGGTSVTTAYAYDGNGVRVKKSVTGGGETSYIGAHYELYDTGSQTIATKYIFTGNTRVVMIKNQWGQTLICDYA